MPLLAIMLLILLTVAPAQASTLASEESLDYDTRGQSTRVVTYVLAGTAAADAIDIAWEGGALRIRDPAGVEGSAEGCTRQDAGTLRCDLGRTAAAALRAELGAGDDRVRFPSMYRSRVVGGDGDDRLEGNGGTFEGGLGDDVLLGGVDDSEDMDGGPGADVLDPGTGTGSDRLIYSGRSAGVRVNAGGDAAAGEAGERDTVKPGFEFVFTSDGPDHVVAAPEGTWIESGAGDDVLEGGRGWDRLKTGDGADVARGGGGDDEIFGDEDFATPGRDTLDGGPGKDYVLGSAGPDTIIGGPGRDALIGGLGVDRLFARDGERDDVWCEDRGGHALSPTRDFAQIDGDEQARWCGVIDRSGPARAELLFAGERRAVHRTRGTVRALVACPGRRACHGTLTIRGGADRRRAGHARFRVPAGRRSMLRVRFRLRGPYASRASQVLVRLRTRDAAGRARRSELDFERRRPQPPR